MSAIAIGVVAPYAILRLPLALRSGDEAAAIRMVYEWIMFDRPISGVNSAYPDTALLGAVPRIVVSCDALSDDCPIADDPRIIRLSYDDVRVYFDQHHFDGCDYLRIQVVERAPSRLVLDVTNMFGAQGGNCYRFEFKRHILGLTANAQLLWVS